MSDQPENLAAKATSQTIKKSSPPDPISQPTAIGPCDANYETKLRQAGILLINSKDAVVKPVDHDSIVMRLHQPQASLSPSRWSDTEFESFKERCEAARTEISALHDVIKIIAGDTTRYTSQCDKLFDNLEPFHPDLAHAKPDVYDGAPLDSMDQRVRQKLAAYIIPSKDGISPAAPNFFLDAKNAGDREDVAHRHCAYVGALGTRAITTLERYSNHLHYDGNTKALSNSLHGGILKTYAHFGVTPIDAMSGGTISSCQLQVIELTSDKESMLKGFIVFRNARQIAHEIRKSAIQRANEMANMTNSEIRSAEAQSFGGDTDIISFNSGTSVTEPFKHSRANTNDEMSFARSTEARRSTPASQIPTVAELSPLSTTARQVGAKRIQGGRKEGYLIYTRRKSILVTDDQWQPAQRNGRAVMYCRKYSVYFYTHPGR